MTVHRFYCPELAPGRCILRPDETQHALRVLRLGIGDPLELFDGHGGRADATLASTAKSGAAVDVAAVERIPPPVGPRLILLTALPRQQRQPYVFEKGAELGVAAIRPVIFARSTVIPKAASAAKWQRSTIEAAKQSGCRFLPRIDAPASLAATLADAPAADVHLVAEVGPGHRPFDAVIAPSGQAQRVNLWIGPEGGFTDEERAALSAANIAPVTLGPHTLRIETAAIAAASICAVRQTAAPA